MPTISEFYGIKIYMYFTEHEPSHIHVFHEGNVAVVDIKTGAPLHGSLKPRARKMVQEWVLLHQEELENIWNTKKMVKIAPLE